MAEITVISGSTLGTAEYVAEQLAEELENAGFSTSLIEGAELHQLPLSGLWIVVCSTYGAGDLPDNLQPLFEQIKQQQPDLSSVRFAAIGLGSSDYDTFCGAIRQIDVLLQDRGAIRIGDRVEIDVIEHPLPEEFACQWIKKWLFLL
ncbi:FMN-binding protein MioC [Serratia microhaemolytica]|uniref:FMN-binding protein MioC n=1 Tax=Serratia microhaemolytica TaxID=2675110 RepID=UPI000FDEF891|nr:FMN-binding protein MioC [Serratia microhaemolytica]